MDCQNSAESIERSIFDRVSTLALGIIITVIPAGALSDQVSEKTPDKPQAGGPGLEVGEVIPSFNLRDQNGDRQTFESLRGSKGLLLLVHRSADW